MLAERQDRLRKVAAIFQAFDTDRDAKLNRAELTTLIQQCNPGVLFSEVQLDAITREVARLQSLSKIYATVASPQRGSASAETDAKPVIIADHSAQNY